MFRLKSWLKIATLMIIIKFCDSYESVERLGSTCLIREGSVGKCIRFSKCDFLKNKLKNLTTENLNYLRESQCGLRYDEPLVCCPLYVQESTLSSLLPTNCTNSVLKRIVGGTDTNLSDYPWLALLNYKERERNTTSYLCAGSLITNRYILTAAHCVNQREWELINVRLGEWDITNPGKDCVDIDENPDGSIRQQCAPEPVDVDIEEIISYPDYNDITKKNDIALLRLTHEVPTNEYIQVGCLPITDSQRTEEHKEIIIVGWGSTGKHERSSIKKKADIDLFDFSTCRTTYEKLGLDLEETQFCAKGDNGTDTCYGDSGGSASTIISTTDQVSVEIIVGITSFGYRDCGSLELPSIYTRVSPFIEWISENLEP